MRGLGSTPRLALSRRLSLLLVLAAGAAQAEAPPAAAPPAIQGPAREPDRSLAAARRRGPIVLDGRMDEPAWLAAELGRDFRQTEPDDGASATVETRFRILWDEEALWVGVECDDDQPLSDYASRRDRSIDADHIRFDFDTLLDRRTAFHFQVFAAGQQLDGLHSNDVDYNTDWDAIWESEVARTPKGWSVEIRIPVRVLRIPDGAKAFGFNIIRRITRRHETAAWAWQPREIPGLVSQFGLVTGVEGIRPVRALELRPYVALSGSLSTPQPAGRAAPGRLGPCGSLGFNPSLLGTGCAGLDFKYGLSGDLSLVGAVNPDFGQVEVDSRVLNLTTYETSFPEKRPFFLEGMDLFNLPQQSAYTLFYSRRIGSALPSMALGPGEALLYQPAARPVDLALKLSGNAGPVSVSLLSSLEPVVSTQLLQADGTVQERLARGAVQSTILRARAPLGSNMLWGAAVTGMEPLFSPGARHAHAGVIDGVWFDSERDWNAVVQLASSRLTGGPQVVLRDGTALEAGASGFAASGRVSKDGGPLIGSLTVDALTPDFWVNDLGFMSRANLVSASPSITLRDLKQSGRWHRAELQLLYREQHSFRDGLALARVLSANAYALLRSFWTVRLAGDVSLPAADDRELGDGTPLQTPATASAGAEVASDPQKLYSGSVSLSQRRGLSRFQRQSDLKARLLLRPLPPLEGSLELLFTESTGQLRRLRGATGVPELGGDPEDPLPPLLAVERSRLYLLAPQAARSVSAIARVTWALTSRLSLQGYAQVFTVGLLYGDPLRAVAEPGRDVIALAQLEPARASDLPAGRSERQASLNLNLILRWEWRLGSTLYLVYGHQTANALPEPGGLDVWSDLRALNAGGAKSVNTLLLKMDVLAL